MIEIRFPSLPLNGELQWSRESYVHRPGQALAQYLDGDIDPSVIARAVVNGHIISASDLSNYLPANGDEITIVPAVGGKNGALISGVLGAIAAFSLAAMTGGGSLAWFFASGLGAASGGFAIGTLLYTIAHPPRTSRGDKTGTTYTFEGLQNEDREGAAQPVVMGDTRAAGVRVNSFIRVGVYPDPSDATKAKPGERSYQLINVSKARYGIKAISDVRVNDEPISNFAGADYAYTLGDNPEQWYSSAGSPITRPEAFDVNANTFAQNQELTTTPYVYTTSAITNVDAIELILAAPFGIIHTHKGSDSDNATRFKVRYRVHGATPWTNYTGPGFDVNGIREIKLRQQSNYVEVVRIAKPPYGNIPTPARYDVELTWVSADYTSPSGTDVDQWKVYLVGVTEEVGAAVAKPGYSLLAVTALAVEHLNGAPPTTTCRCKGIKVPWWDGAAWQAPTWDGPDSTKPIGRNPAWLILEAHRDKDDVPSGYTAWGAGLDDTRIYLPQWKTFADKCSTLESVTDSNSNTYNEPRHQLDIVLNEQRSFDQLIRDLLATARAAPCMAGNGAQHGVFYDDNDTAVQLVTMGNMAIGTFQPVYDFSRRVNTFDVTYQDASNDYNTVTRTVVNAHLVTTLGKPTRRESIAMLGVTRFSQILRDATYNLRKHEYTKIALTFEMRTDAILWRVGDVINVQHELPQWGYGGRVRNDSPNNTVNKVATSLKAHVVGGFVNVIDIDGNDIPINLGIKNYEVRVRLADGSGEEGQRRDVSAVAVSADGHLVCTVSTPFTSAPSYTDPFTFGEYLKSAKPYRCIAITRSARSFRRVTCTEFNASIFAAAGTVEVIDYSDLPRYGGPPPPIDPMSCIAHEDLSDARAGNSAISTVVVEWKKPARTSGYGFYAGADVEVSYDGTNWTLLKSRVVGAEFRWEAAPLSIALQFRVTPVSTAGRPNQNGRATSNSVTCIGRAIVPQNPTSVTLTKQIGRYRAVRSSTANTDPNVTLRHLYLFANWSFADAVNPAATLVGFRVMVYPASGGDPHNPYWASGVLTDTTQRTLGIPNLPFEAAGDYVAAVQAVYIDGYVSAFATSSGVLLDPTTYEPIIRSGDDRVIQGYAESFDAAGLPTGFLVFNATYAISNGEIQLTKTSGATQLSWHVDDWAAAYLDNNKGSNQLLSVFAFIRVAFDVAPTAGQSFTLRCTPPGLPEVLNAVVAIPDTLYHTYRVPFGSLGEFAPGSITGARLIAEFTGILAGGNVVRVSCMAIAVESVDVSFDGQVDRAIQGRNQFGRDSVGLGYFLESPIRENADPAGNVVVIEKNGMFWLRSGGGTEVPVKLVRKAQLRGGTDKEAFTWGSAVGSASGIVTPTLPTPIASSKVRILAERAADQPMDTAPTYYPQRTQLEALEITKNGFRIAGHRVEGPGYGSYEDPVGGGGNSNGWAASATKKSALALASSASNVNNGDAWYDLGQIHQNGGLTRNLFYDLRCVLWIAVTMPTAKKADGTYYYADLEFDVYYSATSPANTNPLDYNGYGGTIYTASAFKLRVYTDGTTQRYPLVVTPVYGISAPTFKVDWYSQSLETGGSAPSSVWLDRFEASEVFIFGGTAQHAALAAGLIDLNLTYVEEW